MEKVEVDLYDIAEKMAGYLGVSQDEFINTVEKIVSNEDVREGEDEKQI